MSLYYAILSSAALLALSCNGDVAAETDTEYQNNFQIGTMAQAQMAGGSLRALQNSVISADYSPDGNALAVVRQTNGKVQLEFPPGRVLYETSGYLDYIRVSPTGKHLAFLEHPVYDDDRGWVSIIDAQGHHMQLTKEFESARGLAWSRTGSEIWFTADESGTNLQLYAVTLAGKMRQILTAPQRIRILDIAPDGRVLLSSEQSWVEITGLDPETGKERRGLEWFEGSGLSDVSPDGRAIAFFEWGGAAGPLYKVVYRRMDGSAPVMLGSGARPRFSPDGRLLAALIFTLPPQITLLPLGTGVSRQLPLADITSARKLAWFPDGKHLLVYGAIEGHSLRTYEMDLEGGKPQPLGPPNWEGMTISQDGKRIAGQGPTGETIVFDAETQKMLQIRSIEPQESLLKWTEDGRGLLVLSATPWESRIYRAEVATGKRTLLRTLELNDKAGSVGKILLLVADDNKTYVYATRRIIGNLYLVDGLK